VTLSITTDYAADKGDPSPYLERIAQAGFTHVHWCHQWNTDFYYSHWEIDQIERWFKAYGLQLLDLHGSVGPEKDWASNREYERLAGLELVRNRIEMASRLGGNVVIMHAPRALPVASLARSLDTLEAFAREKDVRIAIENTQNWPVVEHLLSLYDRGFLGLCYDAGHGNLSGNGLERLETLSDRLISVHLHDNDGLSDQHKLPFSGTIDWERLARILARSSYLGPISMEAVMRHAEIANEEAFLSAAYSAGMRLTKMLGDTRVGH
jgi:sugar phosphate isomerase/epimerase